MDLETLSIWLKKDPENYVEEYQKVLQAYSSMIDLPIQNASRLKQFIDLLSSYVFKIKSDFPLIAMEHLQITTDSDIRRELVKLMILFYKKQLVTPDKFMNLYMKYSDKLEIAVAAHHNDLVCLKIFFEYLDKGNDRQKCFSLLMIAHTYENVDFRKEMYKRKKGSSEITLPVESQPVSDDPVCNCESLESKCVDLIMSNLFTVPKLIKISILYFLGEIDFCASETARIVEQIGFKTAEDLCRRLIKNIRAKSDLREIRIQKYKVVGLLKKYYSLEIQVGSHLLRLIDPSKEDVREVLKIIVDTVDKNEVYSIVDKILDTFCCEHKDDDFIIYGMNVLKEFVSKFDVGEYVFEKINFRYGKSKGVFYAHNMLMRMIKKKDVESRDVGYVRKRASKEEKLKKAMDGRGEVYFRRKAATKKKRLDKALSAKCNRGRDGKVRKPRKNKR